MRLNERISIKTFGKVDDGFGGYTNVVASTTKHWCNVKHKEGDIETIDGKRERSLEIEIIMREKSAESISVGQLITYNGQDYRLTAKYQSKLKYFTTLEALGV